MRRNQDARRSGEPERWHKSARERWVERRGGAMGGEGRGARAGRGGAAGGGGGADASQGAGQMGRRGWSCARRWVRGVKLTGWADGLGPLHPHGARALGVDHRRARRTPSAIIAKGELRGPRARRDGSPHRLARPAATAVPPKLRKAHHPRADEARSTEVNRRCKRQVVEVRGQIVWTVHDAGFAPPSVASRADVFAHVVPAVSLRRVRRR